MNKTNRNENIRIGKILQSARESGKITQAEMAKATGMSKNQISAIECGQGKASVELLLGYCHKLDRTPNDILGFRTESVPVEMEGLWQSASEDIRHKMMEMMKILAK